ncbi:MAG: hypothetical protein AAF938_10210 [Myxococcota bacterium]
MARTHCGWGTNEPPPRAPTRATIVRGDRARPVGLSLSACVLVACSGCLGSNYRVSGSELDRIASQPRGGRVTLIGVQELSFSERDPGAGIAEEAVLQQIEEGSNLRRHPDGLTAAASVARAVPRIRGMQAARNRRRGTSRTARGSRRGSSRSSRGSDSDRGGDGIGRIAAVVVAAAVVAAGAIAIAAGTEGARYDGLLEVEHDHTLHLYRDRPHGERLWTTTTAGTLTPEVAAWADGAILRSSGGDVLRLGRRHLDRVGLTFSVLGVGSVGGGVHAAFGTFFSNHVGLVATFNLQGRSDVLNVRGGGELQLFLPDIDRFSLGAYAGAGVLRTRQDVGDDQQIVEHGGYYSAGLLVQIELTTRLAIELRGGLWRGLGVESAGVFPTLGFGLAVF